jgi:hypothetical protein
VIRLLKANPSGINKPDMQNMLKGAVADRRATISEMLTQGVIREFKEGRRLVVVLNPAVEH